MQIVSSLPDEAASTRSERIWSRLAKTRPLERMIGPDPVIHGRRLAMIYISI
jgi:hypothetical protein